MQLQVGIAIVLLCLPRPQNRETDLKERPAQPAVMERLNTELKHIKHLRLSYV